jgi:hypothetical protein
MLPNQIKIKNWYCIVLIIDNSRGSQVNNHTEGNFFWQTNQYFGYIQLFSAALSS